MGRPLKKIDPEQVKALATIGCTKTEVAIMVGCSVDTIHNRFSAYFELGDVQGKTQLRRRQHARAVEDGSDNMLMFLGKHRLGQKDRDDKADVNALFDDALTEPKPEASPGDESLPG